MVSQTKWRKECWLLVAELLLAIASFGAFVTVLLWFAGFNTIPAFLCLLLPACVGGAIKGFCEG